MYKKTFAGKSSALLERQNRRGRLPVDDSSLAQRGWELVTPERLRQMLLTGRVMLAVPRWRKNDTTVIPRRISPIIEWSGKELDLWFDRTSRSRGMVFARYVHGSNEVLAEASYFYLHAVTESGMAFRPEKWV